MRMHSGFLPLLCYLLVVHSCYGNAVEKTVVVFQSGKTKLSKKENSSELREDTLTDFTVPAFVGGELDNKEFLAIISGAQISSSSRSKTMNGVVRTRFGTHNQWSPAEVFTNDAQTRTTHTLGDEFTAVMKENKIYLLAKGFYKKQNGRSTGRCDKGWEPLMFVGTVTTSTDSTMSRATITWEAGKPLKDALSDTVSKKEETCFYGGVGNSIVTKSGAIVFPIQMNEQPSKTTSSIMYSIDNGSKWTIGAGTHDNTYEGSVVEWGDEKLLLIVSSNNGFRKVFESEDMGRTWEESLVFSRVWGNVQGRASYGKQGSVIKVPVDSGEILLFAHPLTANGGSSADTLQLWLSDGQRIVRIGTISDKEKEQHTGYSILAHVGGHLYITHEINPSGYSSYFSQFQTWIDIIGFTPLPDFFESAKTTVRKWRQLDTSYQSTGINTKGLVGVLGETKDVKVWADMYNCVNATVKGGESVSGGFRFDGKAESGAQWPVESQGQNQVYIFAEKQFTLAATVTVHTADEEGQFSLIGASLNSDGNNVILGLGYTHDNRWYVVGDNNQKSTTAEMLKRETEYHVALTFGDGKASVYVNGVSITEGEITLSSPARIHHFYMGGIEQSSTNKWSSCTVKNVMLFNKPLLPSEIAQLAQVCKKNQVEKEEETSTALPTLITEDRTSVSRTKVTTVPESSNSMSTTNLANIPQSRKTLSTTKVTTVPESSKSVSKSDPPKAPVPSLKNVIYEKVKGTKMHTSQQEFGDGVLTKDTKGNIDAVMSLSAMGGMVFLCFFILLAGF